MIGDPVWKKIFQKTPRFYICKDIDIPRDLDDPLCILYQNGKLDDSKQDIIQNVISGNKEAVMELPNSVFILDVPQTYADEIQNDYGVICLSSCNPDPSILTLIDPYLKSPIEGETDISWNDIFEGLVDPRIPSNSLVINDRNLFANDKIEHRRDGSEEYQCDGLDNIKNILENALPRSFKGTYHIFIICDKDCIKGSNNLSFERISNRLNKIKSGFVKEYGYDITLEIAAVGRGNDMFGDTHNRRIFSNYYTVSADHKFCAFKGLRASCTQDIHIMKLFSSGISDRSDSPVKSHDYSMKVLKSCIQEWKLQAGNKCFASTYEYSQNGNTHTDILSFRNRLIK